MKLTIGSVCNLINVKNLKQKHLTVDENFYCFTYSQTLKPKS